MQPSEAPTTADCRALRAALKVENAEISERTGYSTWRIARVLNDNETSAPLVAAVHDALVAIRDERRAAAGDRSAMDRLDAVSRSAVSST